MPDQTPRTRTPPPPRPTTPLRPPSRSSLRSSTTPTHSTYRDHTASSSRLNTLEPLFAELSDSTADLEANFVHLQLMHESLARFCECFASFMYGLDVNAFCVDFPEAPLPDSFKRAASNPAYYTTPDYPKEDMDQTFLTTDSFVENPPSTVASKSTVSTPRKTRGATPGRGTASSRTTPGAASSTRGASRARGRGGIPTSSTRGRGRASGIARASGSTSSRGRAR